MRWRLHADTDNRFRSNQAKATLLLEGQLEKLNGIDDDDDYDERMGMKIENNCATRKEGGENVLNEILNMQPSDSYARPDDKGHITHLLLLYK